MFRFLILMIILLIAMVFIFPIWSKERQTRIDRHKFMEEWSAKEIMSFILWILFTTGFAFSFLGFILSVF